MGLWRSLKQRVRPESPADRRVCDFLWYGYLPSNEVAIEQRDRFAAIGADDTIEIFEPDNPESAKRLLCKIVSEQLNGATEVALPLSAGLDSRGLLGALLECIPAKGIQAYTFGQETTHDYSNARRYTEGIIPNHTLIDVSRATQWNFDELVALRRSQPKVIGQLTAANRLPQVKALDGLPSFNGFFGDAVTGAHLPVTVSLQWRDATKIFARKNRAFRGPIALVPERYQPADALPAEPPALPTLLSYDDFLDFAYRQEQRIRGVKKDIRPYTDPRWIKSFLRLKPAQRVNQSFYRHFLGSVFPKVFPDLDSAYKQPHAKKKNGQIVDMDNLFAENTQFRAVVEESASEIDRSGVAPWLAAGEIVKLARDGQTSVGRQLLGLVSLGVCIRAGHF